MKNSIPRSIILPVVLTVVTLCSLSALSILASLHTQLALTLENEVRRTWASSPHLPEHTTGTPITNSWRSHDALIIGSDSIGTLPFDQASRLFGTQEGGSQIVPSPDQFLDHPLVGLVFGEPANAGGKRYWAVLVPSHDVALTYREVQVRLLLWMTAFVITALAVATAISSRLIAKLKPIVNKVRSLVKDDQILNTSFLSEDPGILLEQELERVKQNLVSSAHEVERLQVVRSQFLANVSHEIRTPIFALRGYLDALLDGGLSDQKVSAEFIQKASLQTDRIDVLLKDLIDIARIESGEMKMSFRYFDLRALGESVLGDLAEAAAVQGQSLKLESGSGPGEVVGDRDRLRQVLVNLIENAIRYSGKGSSIRLSLRFETTVAHVEVVDTGSGIPAEHLPRLFERFYRVNEDRSRELGGTGLGLAIVKHIIEAHGSKISVASNLGRGTQFAFILKR